MFTRIVAVQRIANSAAILSQSQSDAIADEIELQIESAPVAAVLYVDFRGIRCATLAGLRAILKAIGERSGRTHPSCSVLLRFDTESRDVIDSFSLMFRESGRTMLAVHEDEKWEVLGSLTPSERETLEILMKRESITSHELSSLLGIKLNAASTRLKKLYDRDLAARHEVAMEAEGGRKFVYQRLFAGPDAVVV